MATFFTSDQHFGHVRISELSGRPFSNVPAMNAHLVHAWNARITDQDTVWVLGDVCMGKLSESLDLIALLCGRKILVPGNHDRCWNQGKLGWKGQEQRYLDAGFDRIIHGPAQARVGSVEVTVSHLPFVGDSQADDRYLGARPEDKGQWLIHGHVHEKWRQRGKMINVGVDAWGGKPVSEHTLATMITAGPADISPQVWHTSGNRRPL